MVVSFTGTWIETNRPKQPVIRISVVSFTGTWIETKKKQHRIRYQRSYPLRVRGLKQEG